MTFSSGSTSKIPLDPNSFIYDLINLYFQDNLPVLSQIFHMIIAAFVKLDVSGAAELLIPDLDFDMVSKLPLCS